MAKKKNKFAYVCSDCGAEHSQWQGQCISCEEWNTLSRISIGPTDPAVSNFQGFTGAEKETQWLAEVGKRINIKSVITLISKGKTGKSIDLPKGVKVKVSYGTLIISDEGGIKPNNYDNSQNVNYIIQFILKGIEEITNNISLMINVATQKL